jgi:hypothetical protein
VSVVTRLGLDDRGSIPVKGGIFLFGTASRPALGHIQHGTCPEDRGLFPGVKLSELEPGNSLPSSAEVKNVCEAIPPLIHTSSWRDA